MFDQRTKHGAYFALAAYGFWGCRPNLLQTAEPRLASRNSMSPGHLVSLSAPRHPGLYRPAAGITGNATPARLVPGNSDTLIDQLADFY